MRQTPLIGDIILKFQDIENISSKAIDILNLIDYNFASLISITTALM